MKLKSPIEDFFGAITPFLDKIFAALQKDRIDVTDYELDHLCYRVASIERYETCKQLLLQKGILLTESIIGNRPIATFKLSTPIIYQGRTISCLELPSPKAGSFYPEGFEHVEFVIDEDFEKFMTRYYHLSFKTKAITKAVNPDISRQYDGFSVKFHHHPLEYVIQYLD